MANEQDGMWDSKKMSLLALVVDAVKMGLHVRQIEKIAYNKSPPETLRGALSQEVFENIKNEAEIKESLLFIQSAVMVVFRSQKILEKSISGTWASLSYMTDPDKKAVVFSIIDEAVSVSTYIVPTTIVRLLLNDNPDVDALKTLSYMIQVIAASSLLTGIRTFLEVKVTNYFGKGFFWYRFVIQAVILVIGPFFTINFILPLVYSPLPDGSMKTNVDNAAEKAGYYPRHAILYKRDSGKFGKPTELQLVGHLFSSTIIIPQSLVNALGESDMGGVAAHELGHWYLMIQPLTYLTLRIISFQLSSDAATESYGNEEVLAMFEIPNDQSVHPIIGSLLFNKYIFPCVLSILRAMYGCLHYMFMYLADKFASRLGFKSELRYSLFNRIAKMKIYPDRDPWYAMWFDGNPGLIRRIRSLS